MANVKFNGKVPLFSNQDMQDTIPHLLEFEFVYETLREVDLHDEEIISRLVDNETMQNMFPIGNHGAREDLIRLIEQVWDIAYIKGYRNGAKHEEE